jgi:hypothetical protein
MLLRVAGLLHSPWTAGAGAGADVVAAAMAPITLVLPCWVAHECSRRLRPLAMAAIDATSLFPSVPPAPPLLPPPFSFSVTSSSLTLPPQVVATSIFVLLFVESLGRKL